MTGDRQRCRDCDRDVRAKLKVWRSKFLAACSDGLLTRAEWNELKHQLEDEGIALDEGVKFIRRDALGFVERAFAFAKADGQLDGAEEEATRWLIHELNLDDAAPYLLEEAEYLSHLRRIGEGDIPTVAPSVILPADELCYFEGSAHYFKVNRSSTAQVPGCLIITNRRVIFAATSGGGEIPLGKILNVSQHSSGVFLELSRKANSGFYAVEDSRLVATIILAAARLATRQLIAPGDRDTRHIPHHVKVAVWQRDQGQCVQCNASDYLEFDHIIPHSKGGATSLGNLQLLCRRCNLQKGESL